MDAQRSRRWDRAARKRGYVNLPDATVLIVGVGGIGAATARLLDALGARVLGVEPRPERESPAELFGPERLDDLLPEADFVVTTVPHTPETEGMWNAPRFDRMKPGAYFINIGRGMTTRLDDLVEALESGRVGGAGLDVFETEPLPADHPLWGDGERADHAARGRRGRGEPRGAPLWTHRGEPAAFPRGRAVRERGGQGEMVLKKTAGIVCASAVPLVCRLRRPVAASGTGGRARVRRRSRAGRAFEPPEGRLLR